MYYAGAYIICWCTVVEEADEEIANDDEDPVTPRFTGGEEGSGALTNLDIVARNAAFWEGLLQPHWRRIKQVGITCRLAACNAAQYCLKDTDYLALFLAPQPSSSNTRFIGGAGQAPNTSHIFDCWL